MPQTCEKRKGTYSLHVVEAHVCNKIYSHTTQAAESKHFMHATLFTPNKHMHTRSLLTLKILYTGAQLFLLFDTKKPYAHSKI